MLNLGYFDDKDATYKVYVKSLGFETADGIVEIPVGVELDPTSSTENGLENGWKGAEIGTLIYGTEDCGIFAAETTIDWIGYRLALKVNGSGCNATTRIMLDGEDGTEIGKCVIGAAGGVYSAVVKNVTGRHSVFLKVEYNYTGWFVDWYKDRNLFELESFVFMK